MLEDGAVNRAFTNVNLGVGVRVVKGDQTGYGFTEDLTPEGLKLAATTAAAIAMGPRRARRRSASTRSASCPRATPSGPRWEDVRPEKKLPLLRTVNEKAHRGRPARPQGARLLQRRVGRGAGRRLRRPHRRGPAADDHDDAHLRRRAGRQARGRTTTTSPRATASPTTRPSGIDAHGRASASRTRWCSSTRRRRPRARCRWCWRPAPRGSCCTRRSATAWRPTSTARTSRSTPTRSASRWPSASSTSSTRARRSTRAAPSTSTTRATWPARRCWSRTASLTTYLHDRISAKHYGVAAHRQRPPRELPVRADAAHALDLHAAGAAQEGRDPGLGEEGHLLHALHQRPGEHRRRRLHLLREERLPDRGRQAHAPDQGRQHHRQRAEGARARRHGLRRPGDRRGRLDLRQGRPGRPGLAGHADGPRRLDHRGRQHARRARRAP